MDMTTQTTSLPDPDYQLTVEVRPEYLPEESSPSEGVWSFAYHIRITNTGRVAAQVVARHWLIEDDNQQIIEVKGLGVVGQQPVLQPGQSFEYSSGTPLATPHGSMHGSYFCVAVDGERFEAPIAPFNLQADAPMLKPASYTLH